MDTYTLILGSKNTSSWSLRAWLMIRRCGVRFDEHLIEMRQPDTKSEILKVSPSGLVPALRHNGLLIGDTLAIAEYLAELFPQALLWPEDRSARAIARSVSAEMHSGFSAMRKNMPMDILGGDGSFQPDAETAGNIARVQEIWRSCRDRFGKGGDFLFGAFCIADAMYAPVVSRFTTYNIDVDDTVRAYMENVWALPDMQSWKSECRSSTGQGA